MTVDLDPHLLRLKAELDDHARTARYLGLDLDRPIRSLADGYPENAIALVANITERLLKQLWYHHGLPGTPTGRTLNDLIQACRPHIRSHRVIEALHDIQRLRNRSSHDGGFSLAHEDGLTAVRRLIEVLAWYTSTGSGALNQHAPKLTPAAAAQAEFLAGLYVTMDFRLAKRAELSPHTAYLRFTRERGLRTEHVELLLGRDADDITQALAVGQTLQEGLARLTRLVVLDDDSGELPGPLRHDCRVAAYRDVMDVFVDCGRHVADMAALYPPLDAPDVAVAGDVLAVDEQSGELTVSTTGDARELLARVAADGGNLLIVGRPGTGKTTLLKELVAIPTNADGRRHRFFFDLGLKSRDESVADFITRALVPYMHVEAAYVFPVFCYFTRAGSVLCALDGFDEAVPEMTPTGLLNLFTEVAEVISAESAVVMTSRVSFLEDSPQVRRLLDGTSLMSEKLAQQLHAQGVDPLRVPRFAVLRLRDDPDGGSLLAEQLRRHAAARARASSGPVQTGHAGTGDLADLLWWHMTQVVPPGLLPRVIEYFGLAFVRGITVFTLVELVNALGIAVFDGGQVEAGRFALRELFRAADPAEATVTFRHAVYQELLTAELLTSPRGRDAALAAATHPRLTEEVREFLHHRSRVAAVLAVTEGVGTCVVPAGVYLVGPSHHLMLRRLTTAVRLDEYPVTVARYKKFLDAATGPGAVQWDHPDMPAGHSHRPRASKLPMPEYYDDPAYGNHPAVAVSWWSAYAFARFEGKRLPSSLEWEAAARGFDGRLFPWGDEVDVSVVTCADSWSDHRLVTYAEWRAERDRGRLAQAVPGPVDAHPGNVSPFGVRELGGNVWEWTCTVLADPGEAVVCGGSFDNPYRAVQASAKGLYHRDRSSAVIGFRCAQDVT